MTGVMKSTLMAVALTLGGCAVGQHINYHEAELDLAVSGKSQVAVSTLDQRYYVKNGEKNSAYVGNFRGGFGNPFNVSTESGRPLADDMTSVICGSLKKKGYGCTPVSVEPSETEAQVAKKLQATNASTLMLLTINDWMSSTFQNTGLTYDLDLAVMNGQGSKVAEQKTKGEDNLGGSVWSPPAHAKEAVPQAYKKKLESVLNAPEVVNALK